MRYKTGYRPDKKVLRKQKAIGFLLLLISAIAIVLASHGTSLEDRDCTMVLILIPLGFWLMFTKKLIIV